MGTTSSTSADPVDAIADIAAREGLWLHVDAAYAGVVALLPDRRAPFAGWERADSIVINPHKWLFTPLDASLLLTRRMDQLRAAFSLVPEYLRTLDRAEPGPRLQRVPAPARPADAGAQAVDAAALVRAGRAAAADRGAPGAGRGARRHGSTRTPTGSAWPRCRSRPSASATGPPASRGATDEPETHAWLDATNTAFMDAVNRTGEVFLSHTRLRDRFTIRIAIGNLRTERRHVDRAWALLRRGRRPPRSTRSGTRRSRPVSQPVEVLYFYRTRWGAHDEFVELFRKQPLAHPRGAVGRRAVH